jgi:hypothetical protein
MKHDRTDALVLTIGGLFALLTIGMTFDIWQLAWLPIPILSVVMIALGCLDRYGRWGASLPPVLIFGVVLTSLFVWAGLVLFDSGRFGGLQSGIGVVYYVIWPFVTVFSGLLYAVVYARWLRHDVSR